MGRRAHGDGSVFYDSARGCWVGQIDAGRDPETGRRRRPKVSAPSKTACRDKLDELREELRKVGTVAPRNVTVAQIVTDLMEHPPASWKSPTTRRVYRELGNRIIAAIGTKPVVKLTARQVEQLLEALAADGMATSTIVRVRSIMKWALRRAQRDGRVIRNVAELADAPRGTVRESRSMTVAQVESLLAQDMTPWWLAYLLVAIGCGLRPGELLGLRWADIDLDRGVVHVRRALHEEASDGHIRLILADLKTPSSRRAMRMPTRTVTALRVLRAWQAAARLKAGSRWHDEDLVFCGRNGQPRWPSGVRATFCRMCKRAGLGADWHPHEQRHTFVSVLSDAGEPIESIAAAAGHKNPGVTKRVYWHAISPEITSAAVAMDGVLSTPQEEPS